MSVDELFEQAVADARAGRLPNAQQKCRQIIETAPKHSKANLMLGIAAARAAQEEEAVLRLKIVIDQEPDNFEALKWMAGALNRQSKFTEAAQYGARAAALHPGDYAIQLTLAQALIGAGKFEESLDPFIKAARIDPKREFAYRGAYQSLMALGRRSDARSALKDAAEHVPSPWVYLRLAELSLELGFPEEAVEWAEKVPPGTPEEEPALVLLAAANGRTFNSEKETQSLDRLAALNPNNRFEPMLRAMSLQAKGQFEDAEQQFLRAIDLDSKLGEAYNGIVTGRRVSETDLPLVERMEKAISAGGMKPDEAGPLRFALGKSYEDLGRYEEAMEQFIEANRIVRAARVGPRPFDRAAMERDVDRTIDLFTKEFLRKHADQRTYDPKTIFVAGAMRSGTTLMEQILSSHPQVGAGGEQVFWWSAARECVTHDPFDPEAGVHFAVIRKKAWEFVKLCRTLAPGCPFVTDKQPANHRFFGIIHLGLPGAPMIQMKRNLADIALSMFTTYFQTGEEYVWDREDIVFALQQHVRLEEHWKKVLPPDRFMEVEYSDLVTNLEPTLRRVLEFCGIEWDDACLRSEDNKRYVGTPSFWQVRQPVNPRSVDRWKRYEPWLGPFKELL